MSTKKYLLFGLGAVGDQNDGSNIATAQSQANCGTLQHPGCMLYFRSEIPYMVVALSDSGFYCHSTELTGVQLAIKIL